MNTQYLCKDARKYIFRLYVAVNAANFHYLTNKLFIIIISNIKFSNIIDYNDLILLFKFKN